MNKECACRVEYDLSLVADLTTGLQIDQVVGNEQKVGLIVDLNDLVGAGELVDAHPKLGWETERKGT